MAAVSRARALAAYRSLLVEAARLPPELNRPGRNLRTAVCDTVRERFRAFKDADARTTALMIDYAEREARALRALTRNDLNNMYKVRVPYDVVATGELPSSPKHRIEYQLSTVGQASTTRFSLAKLFRRSDKR